MESTGNTTAATNQVSVSASSSSVDDDILVFPKDKIYKATFHFEENHNDNKIFKYTFKENETFDHLIEEIKKYFAISSHCKLSFTDKDDKEITDIKQLLFDNKQTINVRIRNVIDIQLRFEQRSKIFECPIQSTWQNLISMALNDHSSDSLNIPDGNIIELWGYEGEKETELNKDKPIEPNKYSQLEVRVIREEHQEQPGNAQNDSIPSEVLDAAYGCGIDPQVLYQLYLKHGNDLNEAVNAFLCNQQN